MESVAQAPAVAARPRVETAAALPWYVTAMLAGSTSIVIGLLWDISWHMTIGRDTFWTPAHMAIYLAGTLAGLSCGYLILSTTFSAHAAAREASVRIWGFRGPLGAALLRDVHLANGLVEVQGVRCGAQRAANPGGAAARHTEHQHRRSPDGPRARKR